MAKPVIHKSKNGYVLCRTRKVDNKFIFGTEKDSDVTCKVCLAGGQSNFKRNQFKQYEIDSFEKLCNIINEDNFEALTTDLIMWLSYHVKYMKSLRKQLPKKYTKDKTNWDLGKSSFIWIDDGKHDMKFVHIKNLLTGEIKIFELTPKPANKEPDNDKE